MRSKTAPRSTLVVKLTFAYDERGVIAPSEDADALQGDVASRYGDETELERPNDFVAARPGVDVVLVGSAYAAHPTAVIGAAIGVDRWSRGFYACSSVPATRIPLVKAYLRGDANPSSAPIRVGPASVARMTDEDRAEPCGPPEQHLEAITSTSRIVLVGLGRGATILDLALPGLEPRLFVMTAGAPAEEPALRCDTLLVDTDRRVVTLTYRTTLDDAAWARATVVLAADWPDDRLAWRAVERQLPRASRLTAIEHAELDAPGTTPGAFVPVSTTIASEEDRPDPLIQTHLHRVDPRDIKPALPFVPAPRAARPFAPGPDTSTVEGRRAPSTADMPFNKPDVPLPPLTKPSPGGAIRPDRTLGSQSNEEHRAIQAATRAVLPPVQIVSAPRPAPLRTIEPIAEELSLERFAAVKAALAETRAPLPRILAEHGIDVEAWHAAERHHVELVTQEAKEGRSDRARAFLDAVTTARSRIAANPGKNFERGGT